MSENSASPFASAFKKLKVRPHVKSFTFAEDRDFILESGRPFGPITVAYETYGRLNPERDNAVLIPHALTGDSHCASHHPGDEPGWWEGLVGPGKAIDTDRYFVICANVLGGCQGTTGPASINPETGRPYGSSFPVITVRDMVRVHKALIDHLGLERVHMVIGGSMGGMQTLEWGVAYSDITDALIAIATPGRSAPQSIAYNEVGRRSIMMDPNWRGGDYYDGDPPSCGLAVARMVGMITYQSDASMWSKFGRELMNATEKDLYDLSTQFQVESYLHYQGQKLVDRFDANSYIYLTRALDLFDIGRGRGGFKEALRRITAPTLVIGISSDILYPTYQQKEIVDALREHGRPVEYIEIDCPYGHDAFLIEIGQMTDALTSFASHVEPLRKR